MPIKWKSPMDQLKLGVWRGLLIHTSELKLWHFEVFPYVCTGIQCFTEMPISFAVLEWDWLVQSVRWLSKREIAWPHPKKLNVHHEMQANLIKFVLKSTCSATILTYLMAPLKLQSLVQLFNDGVSDQYLLTRQKKSYMPRLLSLYWIASSPWICAWCVK